VKEKTKNLPCNCCGFSTPKPFVKVHCDSTNHLLNVVRCPRCGLLYLWPRPSPELGRKYFEDAYLGKGDFANHAYYRDHKMKFERCNRHLDAIESLNPPFRKLFDIGAGQGHFLKTASVAGWQVQGMEISSAARQVTKEMFDIRLRDKIPSSNQQCYGVVTLWDVIEHLDDPKIVIRKATNLLAPGGYLVVQTGNVDSKEAHLERLNWNLWHVDHKYYFSYRTLTQLLNEVGLAEIRHLHITQASQTQDKLPSKTIAKRFGRALCNPLHTTVKGLNFFKTRYIMWRFSGIEYDYLITVVARKLG